MKKISIDTNCNANRYTKDNPNLRIVEFMDRESNIGGLVSFRRIQDSEGNYKLKIEVYRTDPGVIVIGPE